MSSSDANSYAHFYEIVVAFRQAVPDEKGNIQIPAFCEAMTMFLRIFDALSAIGDLVKKDISGNIAKLRAASGKHKSTTMQELLAAEMGDSEYSTHIRAETGPGCNSGAVAVLWMKRTMQFVIGLIQGLMDDPDIALSASARKSYAKTLSKCHSFITRGLFDTGLRFAPARETFFTSLAGKDNLSQVQNGLGEFIDVTKPLLNSLTVIYKDNGLERYIV